MANENLQKMLELSRKVNKMPPAEKNQQPINTIEEGYAPQQMYVPQPQQQREPYSADKEMENIRQGRKPAVDLTNSNLPKNIMESIINNPLDLDPSIVTSGSDVSNFMANLNENSQGIQRMLEMQRQLEGGDKKKQQLRIDEQLKQHSTNNGGGNGVDYSLIKTIVESVVNEKFAELKEELVKNKPDENEVSIMTFRNGFLYVTEDGKVYECSMKFKGYNKGGKKD